MQKAISNRIQLGETLNPLDDYGGDEETLENLIGKVDKAHGFMKTGKADGDLSRYFPNFLPITRQSRSPTNYLERLMHALLTQIKNNWN